MKTGSNESLRGDTEATGRTSLVARRTRKEVEKARRAASGNHPAHSCKGTKEKEKDHKDTAGGK